MSKEIIGYSALGILAILAVIFSTDVLSIGGGYECTSCLGYYSQQASFSGNIEYINKPGTRSILAGEECMPDIPNYLYFEKGVWYDAKGNMTSTPTPGNPIYKYDRSVYTSSVGGQDYYIVKPRQHPDCVQQVQEIAVDAGLVVVAPNGSVYVPEMAPPPQIDTIYLCDGEFRLSAEGCEAPKAFDADELVSETFDLEGPSLWSKFLSKIGWPWFE